MSTTSIRQLAAAVLVVMYASLSNPLFTQQLLGPNDVNALPSKPADARIAYGAAPEQFGDLRIPSGTGPFPLAIVIHGGCFVSRMATLQNSAAMADALRDAGIVTWNIEYRRIGDSGGGWPGTFQDVSRAADYVPTLADRFPIDRSRVLAVGHSAGAFLALWLGARQQVPVDSPLFVREPFRFRTVVAIGADGNLLPHAPALEKQCGSPVADLFFEKPISRARLAQANPVDMLPVMTPQLLISGNLDPWTPRDRKSAYVTKVISSGSRIDEVTIDQAGHFEVVAPTSSAWPLVRSAILSAVGIGSK